MRTDVSDKLLISAVTNVNKSLNDTCKEIWISMNTLKDFLRGNWTDKTEKLIYSRLIRKKDTISDYVWIYKESVGDIDNLNNLLKNL